MNRTRVSQALAAALAAVCAISAAPPEIYRLDYPDFHSTADLNLIASAAIFGTRLRLTPATKGLVGAAWYRGRMSIAAGFETAFRFQLTSRDGGAAHYGGDGFAFVLQNSGNRAAGSGGSSGGFALGAHEFTGGPGIPQSIAVFFDTFRNLDEADPSDNFISISTSGAGPLRWPPPRLALVPRLRTSLKDGKIHQARIVYTPPVMSVYLDDRNHPVLASPVDLGTVVDSAGTAFVGFTASTGAAVENHDILSWSFTSTRESVTSSILFSEVPNTSCLPDRNLCTPQQPTVEPIAGNRYHIVLPANQPWSATIPNPEGLKPAIQNSSGWVCRNFKEIGAAGCAGPAGNGIAGNSLQPESPLGALVWKTANGQTSFSVNGVPAEFKDYEGLFEFDVELGN